MTTPDALPVALAPAAKEKQETRNATEGILHVMAGEERETKRRRR